MRFIAFGLTPCRAAKHHYTVPIGIDRDMHRADILFRGQLGFDLAGDNRILNEFART